MIAESEAERQDRDDTEAICHGEKATRRVPASAERPDAALGTAIPARVGAGLLLLLESLAYARDVTEDPWEFSVEWPELRRLGLTANDGRWLIRKGLVQHARETTSTDDARRGFVASKTPTLSSRSCLILTEAGFRLTRQMAVLQCDAVPPPFGRMGIPDGSGTAGSDSTLGSEPAPGVDRPTWDAVRRELRVGRQIVKEFKVPAPNQEIVLDVFEEENWPPRIDDPLPPKAGIASQRRLHDTINSLNRNQRHRLVRFFADGLGKGVRWEFDGQADETARRTPPDRRWLA